MGDTNGEWFLVDIVTYYDENNDDMTDSFNRELASFIACIQEKSACVSSVEDGKRSCGS